MSGNSVAPKRSRNPWTPGSDSNARRAGTRSIGAAFAKGLTLKMGQTHAHKYMRLLLERIRRGDIDPSFVISHQFPLEEATRAYRMFREKSDDCVKVVLKP